MENKKLLIEIQADGIIRIPIMDGDSTVGERIIDLSDLPTVDAVPVVHGRWETHNQIDSVFYCSVCKLNVSGFERRWLNYCPNCGAKMDGDKHA